MKKVIEISNLDFTYPDKTRALQGVTLDIHEKESVGLIGPNGAGKSTLLMHINGLLNGTDRIRIFDKTLSKENTPFIRRKVGFVFQDPQDQLFMPTVWEDVAFGPRNLGLKKEEVDERVRQALREVDLLEYAHHSSHHLSVGQQRRVSLATVLSMSPEILVLDEPNSNLDHASRRHLINFLKKKQVTVIIATHDLEMILEVCRRVVLLDKGRVIADGPSRDILTQRSLLEAHGLEVPFSLQCKDGAARA